MSEFCVYMLVSEPRALLPLSKHSNVTSAGAVCDQKTSKFFVQSGTCGCKWSLLKVKEGEYKRECGGAQMESRGREHASLLQQL
jgi:hypothetical protein